MKQVESFEIQYWTIYWVTEYIRIRKKESGLYNTKCYDMKTEFQKINGE